MLSKLLMLCTIVLGTSVAADSHYESNKLVAITQIVDHQALNAVRNGVIAELKAAGFDEESGTRVVFENAHGNMAVAVQIAQKFAGMNPDVIIAISTPSGQTAMKASSKRAIPVVFASVTDPLAAKLVTNLQEPEAFVTGVQQSPPLDAQIKLVLNIMPKTKKLGVILNHGEDNSVRQLEMLEKCAASHSIRILAVGAASSATVGQAAASLVGKVDGLFLLQDNTIASALASVMKIANSNAIPVFASYSDAVTEGALAALAYDEYDIGRQTGAIAVKILGGTPPGKIPVDNPRNIELSINTKAAKQLGVSLKADLIARANKVIR